MINEAISLEPDLLLKLKPLAEAEIFEFMKNLRGGTYFNMGMYSSISPARAYKKTIRIYKVIDLTAIVSGVSYENVGTTKDFRQRTGEAPGGAWYDHTPGYENKVAQSKKDPNSKYVLWDVKRGTGTCVRYYVVDIDTGEVNPISEESLLESTYLTESEKAKMRPKAVVGFDLSTGEAVENKTIWRTVKFEHIFWLNQAGKATQEYGVRFEEDFSHAEAADSNIFIDAHAHVRTDLDAILSGKMIESIKKHLEEETSVFMDAHARVKTKLDDVLSGKVIDSKKLKESYDEDEYEITYRVKSWPAGVTEIAELYADSKEEAEETFWAWVLDEENYDDVDEVLTEDDVEVLSIDLISSGDIDESHRTKGLIESYRRTVSRGTSLVDNELFVDFE